MFSDDRQVFEQNTANFCVWLNIKKYELSERNVKKSLKNDQKK